MSNDLQHHVQFLHPGILVTETSTRPIDSRDPDEARLIAGRMTFAFSFYDTLPPLEVEGYTVRPERLNESGYFYLGGDIYTLADVETMDQFEGTATLSNMRNHGASHVIRTPYGQTMFFDPDRDVVLAPIDRV